MADTLRNSATILVASLAALLAVPRPSLAQEASSRFPRVTLPDTADLIYSTRSDDPWNAIFYFLFSRRLQVRLSPDYPEGAPFVDGGVAVPISKQVFERNETGDRAINPMYPTFFVDFGGMLVLRDPGYQRFSKSLKAALDDNSPRSAVARALMQSDLWGAYDGLFLPFLPDDEKTLGERRKSALGLIGRLIKKITLTAEEIEALPENYSVLARSQSFPDVFAKGSGWIEVEWFMPRLHDHEAGFRKVSRVFLKPASQQVDERKFLNSLPDNSDSPTSLDGVALITQLLVLDTNGNPQPTRLTIEAQARLFNRGHEGELNTTVKVCEISRKLLLEDPSSGGLVGEDERAPAYLSNGGSYGFAEGQLVRGQRKVGEPVQVKLRTRCAACHGENLQQLMTFSIVRPPHASLPAVKQLDPAGTEAADFDISAKRKGQAFKALLYYFR